MDSGVGAAGAGHVHRLALDIGDDPFKSALNGRQARLNLPAVEIGTVVGDGYFDAAHKKEGFRISDVGFRAIADRPSFRMLCRQCRSPPARPVDVLKSPEIRN